MAEKVRGRRPARPRRPARSGFGVNVTGHFNSEKGVGEAVRSMIRVLDAARVPYALNNLGDPGSINNDSTLTKFSNENPYLVNLMVMGAGAVESFLRGKTPTYFADRYNAGHCAWELANFPTEWLPSLEKLDEIWVASSFIECSLRQVTSVPVVTVPYTLTGEMPIPIWHRLHFGIPKDIFVFLFIFDFHSFLERKNPLGLIEAFKRAFSEKDEVLLILKCARSEWAPAELKAVQDASRGANIRITDCVMNRDQINLLISLSDCYVSLHRAEGFGLTMAEAMSMEKPVIGTGYSGNTQFMKPGNSFLVDYKLISIEQDYGPYKRGFVWADPDLEHAAELMRFVYMNREAAKRVGKKARQEVLAIMHPEVVGAKVRKRLTRIGR